MGGEIFVFGSNLAGRHGKGAALHALQHWGAVYGQGEGLQGQAYGIPTKDCRIQTLDLPNRALKTNTDKPGREDEGPDGKGSQQ